ncbi:MAG: bifunctional glutamate N-acetyltransferase/amino-acid acetyltransferase ArgJ [Gammaproteobacteria bacterium]|nr:bifunctional glutamate N-acetyltransferase/amino-acid acetyltransferase ArgJ [Gammaproteobacteria bacterium]MBT8151935.1 bifunctional glutamate N-acetyltransferase/amino-acid acetyltransferase ArgJ [Gammaproteobacteria bacterium]NND39086.1 bifunctional glutamate N-acetyltransferase/amino-acid acetyltransferase ArgJ [Pseudomonadales bacterium]NNM10593.1 bifunctional glutamate N-acetyltransferase/amino-acid acetyltransferase ArgJ [Pseudomonadales bacterium]
MISTETIHPVAGVRWSALAAGIKNAAAGEPPPDLALMEIAAGASVAAVFTRNAFAAAPVSVARQHLQTWQDEAAQTPVYCLVNAGNANAGTGRAGIVVAEQCCDKLLQALPTTAAALPFSTGVIGEPLPLDKIETALPALVAGLDPARWQDAASAIMTTDTIAKHASIRVSLSAGNVVISGIAKGAGMIKPNMATMLAYVATDAKIAANDLQKLLNSAVNKSFNRITVDGDTSTNDACVLAASGASGVSIAPGSADWQSFQQALESLFVALATAIIRDAEGASKFIVIDVQGGRSQRECLQVAYAVAESPLVKTAFFASDANWGRILAAVGRAGVENLDINAVVLTLDDYCICRHGARPEDYDEQKASDIMARPEINIGIQLGRGDASERVWTSDLSHDYVRINAEYRT